MTTLLPIDDNSQAIPVLGYKQGGAHIVTAAAASKKNDRPFDKKTKVISVWLSAAMNFKTGDSTVTATADDHKLPPETYLEIALNGQQHIAFYGTGTVDISERE